MPPLGTLEELQWSHDSNCYGYACKCQHAGVGTAVPGAAAGNPALPNAGANYHQALIAGAIADGAAQVAGTTAAPPADTPGHYVVALLANNIGFHWMRRDGHLNRWSWKDGNGGTIKYNLLHTNLNRYVYIKNESLVDLLDNNNPSHYAPWAYSNMTFVSYFRIPDAGIEVAVP